jgi:hypothetical protein
VIPQPAKCMLLNGLFKKRLITTGHNKT